MPIKVNNEIAELYEEVRLLPEEKQTAATLLLAMKVGEVAVALMGAKQAIESVQKSLGIALDHDRGASRTTDQGELVEAITLIRTAS